VLTCDADLIANYRVALGHDRIDLLQFAAQPRVHNPVQDESGRPYDVVFAGSYAEDEHPEYREQTETVLAPNRELGLHILDFNDTVDGKYAWPQEYRPHIVGESPTTRCWPHTRGTRSSST
jgi:hypothetical protein